MPGSGDLGHFSRVGLSTKLEGFKSYVQIVDQVTIEAGTSSKAMQELELRWVEVGGEVECRIGVSV